nr:hypothetical protein BaRGS_011405 [Batillaria attramentaria]
MECPVCHEEFSQPKILPCAHLLCRDCLVTWLKSEGEAECPLCRCAIVAATKHRACPEVTELEEKVKEAQAVLSELAAVLSAGESELERAMSELDQHLIQTEKNTQSALADIDAACDRLQKCVEACRRRLKELALAAQSDVAAAVHGGKSVLVERRGKLTSHKRLVERAKRTSPRSSVGDMSTTLKSRVNDLDRSTDLPVNAKVITMATLMIDPQALARVEKELAELGNVDVVNASPQPLPVTVWRFHGNHGQHITFSNNQQTAERTGVKMEQVDTGYTPSGYIFMGVMTVDPASHSCSSVVNATYLPSAYVMWDTGIKCPEANDMECPVCHEDFSQPKILPCAHLLCRDCLVTWLKSEGEAECPLCRCAIVAATKHRACPEVTELEEKVKEAQAVLSELAAMLSAGESELERAMSELDQHLIQTEKNTQSALADIDAACDRLQKCVEACRRRLKELALAAKSDVAAAVHGGKSVLVERRGKLTSHKRLVERAKMTSPRSSVGDMSTTLKSRVNDLDRSTDLPANAKVITKATLIIDPQALTRVEKELAELGKVDVVNALPQPPPVTVWCFHDNHGQFITLSNDQQTAERTGDYGYGVVVSCEQMVANRLYEVKMEQVDTWLQRFP